MSLLKRYALAFSCLLLVFFLTPLVAAAAAAEAVPQIGPAPLVGVLTVMGLGAMIRLKAKDATGTQKTLLVDTDKPEEAADAIEQYAELKAEEATTPLRAQVQRLAAAGGKLREKIAGEILRIRALTAPKSAGGESTFDAEAERRYLLGDEAEGIQPLSVERLLMEFDRLPKREELRVEPATSGDEPAPTGDDPYAGATL